MFTILPFKKKVCQPCYKQEKIYFCNESVYGASDHVCIGFLQKTIFSLVADSNENTGFTSQFAHCKLLYCKVKLTSSLVIDIIIIQCTPPTES